MEPKDWITLSLSAAAFAVAAASFYFSHIHRPSGAMLILLERLFSAERRRLTDGKDEQGNNVWVTVSPQTRNLKYSLSNTGKQMLYIKDVALLRGPDSRGNLKGQGSFLVIPSMPVEAFLIDPGEIKIIEIVHATNFQFPKGYDFTKNCYELISLEIVSADGNRYQICHDITHLGTSGPDLHHPLWDGKSLGSPVRGSGFV
ncbi:hypothetical protein F8N49_03475 [Pseudomonas sp. GXM4]|uniref:hypothetical protein n=1 Tax=Pseudomonas sp. GXM4 TaxID=2651867 RepID=UPI00124D51CB|nr:hypothetical protein [Pseudomonas sp. GXM4]KAB2527450.1 hypothetical protein F8N49_03475 [Pseudomonas sp. GXM4]